jgi:hypothetical protein
MPRLLYSQRGWLPSFGRCLQDMVQACCQGSTG